jgi:hypothetical protein
MLHASLKELEAPMHRNSTVTSGQARETIARLSEQTASLRRFGVVPEASIAEYNESLTAFVPRDKMRLFAIGKDCYVGDTAHPGAFVEGGLFRRLVESARMEFDSLLLESDRQTPNR